MLKWILSLPFIIFIASALLQDLLCAIDYFDIVYVQVELMLVLIIISILLLKSLNMLRLGVFAVVFVFIWIVINITARNAARQYIANIATTKYHTSPEYIEIEFGYEYRKPHSILLKDGKAYYWSFAKRDFIQNDTIRRWL